MEPRVFRYRNAEAGLGAVFFLVWGGGWLFGFLAALASGHVALNGRDRTLVEASVFLTLMGALGIAGTAVAVRLLLGWRNERIELRDSSLTGFDALGRVGAQADLREVRSLRETVNWTLRPVLVVETDRGRLIVRKSLQDFADLRERLERATRGEIVPTGAALRVAPFAQPPSVAPKTYRYRFSVLHLFSFVWCAGCLASLVAGIASLMGVHGAPRGGSVPFVALALLFTALGLWMQLTGWIERIVLSDEGLEWIDFRGRTRIKADWEEVLSLDESPGSMSALRIGTTRGTIQASSYLWGYGDLKRQVASVLALRKD